jgi:hypothetical protein
MLDVRASQRQTKFAAARCFTHALRVAALDDDAAGGVTISSDQRPRAPASDTLPTCGRSEPTIS